MTPQPTHEEIREFLGMWRRLCEFEAMHRIARHLGMFDESDTLPIPACVKVEDWLAEISGYEFPPLPE